VLVIALTGVLGIVLYFLRDHHPAPVLTKVSNQSGTIIGANFSATSPADKDATQAVIPRKKFDEAMCEEMTASFFRKIEEIRFKFEKMWDQRNADSEIKRLLQKAIASPIPRDRAAALYLNASIESDKALQLFQQEHPRCEQDKECQDKAKKIASAGAFNSINEIARLAISSRDPQLYAIAVNACSSNFHSSDGYCVQISGRQWALREPYNGTALLYAISEIALASAPTMIGQRGGELDNAIYLLSQAKKFDNGFDVLARLPGNMAMQSTNVAVLPMLQAIAFGAEITRSETSLPRYRPLMDYCQTIQLADPNRRKVCDDVADRLVNDGSSLTSLVLGTKMGERLAWPASKIAGLREESDALREMDSSALDSLVADAPTATMKARQTCDGMVSIYQKFENILRDGEVRALRAQMASQPLSIPQLAARYRSKHPSATK
jgi:hypothetical protein